ncbi:GAF domain-containing protein [Natronorubrum sp. JWXQ-INN-674]|uniref:GAF domain-containing protein n=1 Tax=Natronorubrum halalkaliphilum TaxID=2691917 RepID=A0A6B0VN48_9EURY|nr:bacterio-opsin activator domain-containing protein [Natronorubrum halalkaliphilum]MXV61989.1 GAF domain-containing protein [Natronorubrum halalkaliphilum]
MATGTALAEATLETLPITVAVLDGDGEILLTNRSWREFGPDDHREDHLGVNYIATAEMDEDDDEHASRAIEGIEAVIADEQETFAMEYPCHSPERKQWFLMRASRFTVDGEVRVSVIHLEITERKVAEIAVEETAAELREEHRALEHVLDRIDGLIRDVTDAVVSATTRDEIERRVCARLAETEPYVLAGIGRADVTTRRLSSVEWASGGGLPLENDDNDIVLDSDDSHPVAHTLETGEPQVVQDLDTSDQADDWLPTDASETFRSVAALPLVYGDVTYGVLILFAETADAFTDRELTVLESLAGTIATAMNAIEARRMLTADGVVELEVAIQDSSLFVAALAAELEATLTYRGLTHRSDGTPLAFFHADRVVEDGPSTDDLDGVTETTILSTYDEGTLLEVAVADDVLTALSEHGGAIRRFDAGVGGAEADRRSALTDATVDLTVDLPNGQSARSVYNLLEERYDVVELLSYHETEQPMRTRQDIAAQLESTLTDRQLTALRKAYYADYFEWPRNVSGDDLAESMDISRSTFHQHLRTAERKLLDELFDGDPPSKG